MTNRRQLPLLAGIFGNIAAPPGVDRYAAIDAGTPGSGFFFLLNNIFLLMGVIAGIYAAVQFILAGFAYMGTNGDPKKFEQAWNRIWQAIIGLLVVAAAFVLTAVIGRIFGIGNILTPTIYGPGP